MSIDRRHLVVSALGLAASPLVPLISQAGEQSSSKGNAWRFSFEGLEGGKLRLADYAGKVILVVNTASRCGYSYQYKGLQVLFARNMSRGLAVIGVPSNDFGGQEPGSNEDIKGFCGGTFGVTFPLAAKSVVRGLGVHPFYRWASDTLGPSNAPRWNFHKYLIGRDGRLVAAFSSNIEPEDPQLVQAIDTELARQSAI